MSSTLTMALLTHWPLGDWWPRRLLWNCPKINSLTPRKFESNFRHAILKHTLVIGGWGISCEIAPIWISLHFADDQSSLVQVMAWCRQATSHYPSQCWPRSLSPYGVTRPQWVNTLPPQQLMAKASLVKSPWDSCNWALNAKSTLVQVIVWCHQAQTITWAKVHPDLCHHKCH